MDFSLEATQFFLEQEKELSDEGAKIVKEKLLLAKENPFRFKRIYGHELFLFRIRFEDRKKEKRLIYEIDDNIVRALCILDRNKEYEDLNKYLKKITR